MFLLFMAELWRTANDRDKYLLSMIRKTPKDLSMILQMDQKAVIQMQVNE